MRAIIDLTLEHGFEELTDPQVAHRAGMTTEAFHKQFRTKEQALLAVVEEFCAELRSAVVRAASQGSSWTEGVRLGMAAYIDCIARHPGVSRVAFVELFGVGAGAANHQASVSEAFTDFLADSGATPQRAPTVALEALTGALGPWWESGPAAGCGSCPRRSTTSPLPCWLRIRVHARPSRRSKRRPARQVRVRPSARGALLHRPRRNSPHCHRRRCARLSASTLQSRRCRKTRSSARACPRALEAAWPPQGGSERSRPAEAVASCVLR